jgi:glutamine synthetase
VPTSAARSAEPGEIRCKRREEADQVRLRPHPWEFALYYDA